MSAYSLKVSALLRKKIRWFHLRSRGTYDVPRIHLDLREDLGRERVARLMQAAGLQGVSQRNTREPRSAVPVHGQHLIW